jgi:hypothetical protein
MAQAEFTNAVNATDLLFFTGHSEAATEKFRFTSQGEIGIAGNNPGTDGQVLTSGGAGAAVAWESAGGGGLASGDIIGADDGAVGAPGLTFADDLDNGFYRITTNSWGVATAGVKVMEFHADGEVSFALQPRVRTVPASADPGNVTGDGTLYGPVESSGETYDIQANYNTSTYVFTAPVSGEYGFDIYISVQGLTGHTSIYARSVCSNEYRQYFVDDRVTDQSGISFGGFHSQRLDAADTGSFAFAISGGSKVVDMTTAINKFMLIG